MELGKEIREFWKDEQGVGVIELKTLLIPLLVLLSIAKPSIT